MTTWIVIPTADQQVFSDTYAVIVETEVAGTIQMNADRSLGFIGSSRITPKEIGQLVALVPSITVYQDWPPPGGWIPNDDPVEA